MDRLISLRNKNHRRAIAVVAVALLAFVLVVCRHDGEVGADCPAVELDFCVIPPHVLTSQWTTVSLLSSERDVGWNRQ